MKKLIMLILFFTCFGVPISATGNQSKVCKAEASEYYNLPLTQDNVLKVIKALGLHHTDIVMKQAILETGHFSSNLAKKGNLFGLRGSKGYYHYRHWSESIIAYRDKIQSRYKQGENYYKFLTRIGYCESSDYVQKVKQIKL